MPWPTAIQALAEAQGGCIRPVQVRRTDTPRTGGRLPGHDPLRRHHRREMPALREAGQVAARLAVPGRLAPGRRPRSPPRPPDETQEFWLTARARAQVRRDTAAANGRDTAELDELIGELDDEIAAAASAAHRQPYQLRTATPTGKRRARSTRRRQDAPDLPKRPVTSRTTGKVFTRRMGRLLPAVDVRHPHLRQLRQGRPGRHPCRPCHLRLPAGRPRCDPLPGAVRPADPEPAPLPRL